MAVRGQHDVVGLDVTVDDALVVGLGQAIRDLDRDLDRVLQVELLVRDQRSQRPPFHELHGDEDRAVLLVDVVDLRDGGVRDRRRRARLTHEAAPPIGIRDEL